MPSFFIVMHETYKEVLEKYEIPVNVEEKFRIHAIHEKLPWLRDDELIGWVSSENDFPIEEGSLLGQPHFESWPPTTIFNLSMKRDAEDEGRLFIKYIKVDE